MSWKTFAVAAGCMALALTASDAVAGVTIDCTNGDCGIHVTIVDNVPTSVKGNSLVSIQPTGLVGPVTDCVQCSSSGKGKLVSRNLVVTAKLDELSANGGGGSKTYPSQPGNYCENSVQTLLVPMSMLQAACKLQPKGGTMTVSFERWGYCSSGDPLKWYSVENISFSCETAPPPASQSATPAPPSTPTACRTDSACGRGSVCQRGYCTRAPATRP